MLSLMLSVHNNKNLLIVIMSSCDLIISDSIDSLLF